MNEQMALYTVEMGVHGAYRIVRKVFETRDEAVARAERWSQSNSIGSYWAQVDDPHGKRIARFNLAY